MTINRYFTLTNSISTLSKRFRVVLGGYNPRYEKKGSVRTTLDGKYDIAQGGVYVQHEYIIKVRQQEEDSDYGTKDDLLTFFSYNQPNPPPGPSGPDTPSNRLTMVDHEGTQHTVVIHGETSPQPLTVVLEGTTAWYNMKILFLFLQTGAP